MEKGHRARQSTWHKGRRVGVPFPEVNCQVLVTSLSSSLTHEKSTYKLFSVVLEGTLRSLTCRPQNLGPFENSGNTPVQAHYSTKWLSQDVWVNYNGNATILKRERGGTLTKHKSPPWNERYTPSFWPAHYAIWGIVRPHRGNLHRTVFHST